ncbi:MAG: methyltransferase domain-containing protein [Candidatus Bathyarchaeota archaeon]|nr:methyltransferase domain-containing protein [Candidatus Bathyarchaeota archaeon]
MENYSEKNREAWNEAAGIHKKNRKINYCEQFKDKNFSTLDDTLSSLLKKIPLNGKNIAQLCCNNGRELLSIVNTAGATGVGFDISDEFIAEAIGIVKSANLNCQFVRTDINHLTDKYNNNFDLVLFTAGALTWFYDLEKLFQLVGRLLKSEGYLVIYEIHPFTNLLAMKDEPFYDPKNPYKIVYNYFRNDPWIKNTGADYIGKTTYKSKTFTSFAHKISDIITAIGSNEFAIKEFIEYPHDVSAGFENLEKNQMVPLSYTIIGRKPKY